MSYVNFEIRKREERACRAIEKYGKTLWHYTDIGALNGIINTREIWLGSAANMNDKEELNGFISDLESEVYKQIGQVNIKESESVFEKIKRRLTAEYPFIFCVSRAYDDAAQWERYAQRGQGVAIVFNTEILYKLIFYNHFIISEEYYGYNAKQHEMKNLLVDYILEGKMNAFSDLNGLIDNLLLCAMIHKHKSFSAEREVRISPYFVKENDSHLQYKVFNTIRRVYIMNLDELCKKEEIVFEDLISSIVLGPKSQQNIEDLKWYFKQVGLPKLSDKISRSNCPLR